MGVFCDRLKLCSTAALDCRTGQNKGRYREKKALIPTHLVDCCHGSHSLAKLNEKSVNISKKREGSLKSWF